MDLTFLSLVQPKEIQGGSCASVLGSFNRVCGVVPGLMGRLGFNRVLDCFSFSISSNSCLCMNPMEKEDSLEREPLIRSHVEQMLKLRDVVDGSKTLAFHLEPKTVVLRVSMHCHGCARKVEKHISKMEGVTSFEVDLENKKVVVMGDITPFEVLQCVSKVKFAELWVAPQPFKSQSLD